MYFTMESHHGESQWKEKSFVEHTKILFVETKLYAYGHFQTIRVPPCVRFDNIICVPLKSGYNNMIFSEGQMILVRRTDMLAIFILSANMSRQPWTQLFNQIIINIWKPIKERSLNSTITTTFRQTFVEELFLSKFYHKCQTICRPQMWVD